MLPKTIGPIYSSKNFLVYPPTIFEKCQFWSSAKSVCYPFCSKKKFRRVMMIFFREIAYQLFIQKKSIRTCYHVCMFFQALNKKEHKGCESPDPDVDPYAMTPDEKYSRMNEEYQRVMHQNSMRVRIVFMKLLCSDNALISRKCSR